MKTHKEILDDYLFLLPSTKTVRLKSLKFDNNYALSDVTYYLHHELGVFDIFWPKQNFTEEDLEFPLNEEIPCVYQKDDLALPHIQKIYDMFCGKPGKATTYSKLEIKVSRWNKENNDMNTKMLKFHFAFTV